MAGWYTINFNYKGEQSLYGTFIGRPHEKDGVVYATKDNPIVRILCRDAQTFAYYNSTEFYWGFGGSTLFTTFFTEENVVTKGHYIAHTNKKISGKYRFRTGATKPPSLVYIPINFSVNDVYYFGLETDGNTDYAPTETMARRLYFTIPSDNGSVFARITAIEEDGLVDTLKNSVIDFGVVEQNIPDFFYDWINDNLDYIYPNTYTVKSQTGTEELGSLTEAPNIKKAFLNVIGNTKTLILIGENDQEYTVTWDSETPDGKTFNGLSFTKNGKVANIGIGVETEINLTGSATFYEVYSTYRPPVTTFDINLYSNTAEANRVDKTNYITPVGTLSGVLRSESSITDMSILFESENVPVFNYVYIPSFNRYYFVNDITSIRYKLWEMSISVDTLMTYKNAILSCVGFIDRNENSSNPNIVDKNRVIEQGHTIHTETVTNELFTTTRGTYVLNGLLLNTYSKPVEESEVQNAE